MAFGAACCRLWQYYPWLPFKILRWEFADLLLLIGLIGFPIVVLVRFLLTNEKTLLGYVWTFFLIIWSITALFVIFHWEGANQLFRLRSVAFYGLLIVSAVTVVSRLRKGEITLAQIIGFLSTVLIILGTIFRLFQLGL